MRGQGHGSLITITIRCWWDALSVVSLFFHNNTHNRKVPFCFFYVFLFACIHIVERACGRLCRDCDNANR